MRSFGSIDQYFALLLIQEPRGILYKLHLFHLGDGIFFGIYPANRHLEYVGQIGKLIVDGSG